MRRSKRQLGDGSPVRAPEGIELQTQLLTWAPGARARAGRCLKCGQMIGGQQCRVVLLVPPDPRPCICGSIDVVAAMVCGSHRTLLAGEVASLFIALTERATENKHQC